MAAKQGVEIMSEKNATAEKPPVRKRADKKPARDAAVSAAARRESLRWWIKLFLTPVLLLAVGVLLIAGLGTAQKLGWISASGGGGSGGEAAATAPGEEVLYVCPMMCTPPMKEPGRCPVCAMELVPASSGGGNNDKRSIQVDPAARRVANIRTAAVEAVPLTRKIRTIGELNYDEGARKTIAAYVDGRLERLYADYTGVVVEKGDRLALLYSPKLYSSQVELLVARRARQRTPTTTAGSTYPGSDLYGSARQRLREFGMTDGQIKQLEAAGKANSRLELVAPISGTVIEKLAVEGQYVKTGQPIYRLADLSAVWLMLRLFPEDATAIRYGQKVEATVQSLPGRKFNGRVAFVDPHVDPNTRTVGVRVVISNEDGLLRIGDYARATIDVPLGASGEPLAEVYDPELANKWISPRHPHVVESSPGKCRFCGVDLVPAARFGFAGEPVGGNRVLVVPRSAVLMAGANSVVYVETDRGRFELRNVVLGPTSGQKIAILDGVNEGDLVATAGNFLIDSQMQLVGNPSLIDPTRGEPGAAKVDEALAGLSAEDRALAETQRICPVTGYPLGSMGTPPKVEVNGRTVFICCEGCRESLLEELEKHLARLDAGGDSSQPMPQMDLPPMDLPMMEVPPREAPPMEAPRAEALRSDDKQPAAIAKALGRLSPADRALAERQRICPVAEMPLGSMGTPIKVDVRGRPVFICCEGCRESLLAEPARYLDRLPKEADR